MASSESSWQSLVAKTEQISFRERLLITFAGLVLTYGLAELLYFDQLRTENRKLDNQMEKLKKDQRNHENELLVLRAKKEKPKKLQAEIKALDEKIRGIEEEILGFSDVMTQPETMTATLKEILSQRGELNIKSLKNEEAVPIQLEQKLKKNNKNVNDKPLTIGLYRHSLELELEGSFEAAKRFVKKIESANKNLYWESIEYEVVNYPLGRLTIRVFTLSREKEWIGA